MYSPTYTNTCIGGSRGGTSGLDPLKNHKNKGFLCNSCPDPLNNHKATKPAFNVGPSSAHQRNATASGPMMAHLKRRLYPLSPYQLKEKVIKFEPPLKKFLDPRMTCLSLNNVSEKLMPKNKSEREVFSLIQSCTWNINGPIKCFANNSL